MKTSRTISNVSYNSMDFFKSVIDSLYDDGLIEWCYWILHHADTDESKEHIHFVLRPSSKIDTTDLKHRFDEIDMTHPTKPLSCTSKWFFTNSMDDWLLYVVHDVGYLASKGQVRNYHYLYEDLCSTDEDALHNDWSAIDRTKYNRLKVLEDAIETGTPFVALVQTGFIPISQRAQYEQQYNALARLKDAGISGRLRSHENDLLLVDDDGVIRNK